MPKIKVGAQELYDVDVTHISLVQRGANRVPFRIIKSADGKKDTAMLNFRSLFKTAPSAPAVAAVIVSKSLPQAAATAVVEKAGFATDKLDADQDGAYVFAQVDGDVGDGVLLKMDDYMAVMVTGDAITKAMETYNFDTMSFGELMAQEGFVPSFTMATEMLKSAFMNMVSKAESRDDLVSAMESAVDEFGDFVTALARSVPEDAFRAEFMKYDDLPGDDMKDGDEPDAKAKGYDKDKAKGGKKKADADPEAGPETSPEADAAGAEGADDRETAQDDAEEPEGNDGGSDPADVAAAVKAALDDALAPLAKSIGDLRKVVDSQGERIETVAENAKKAEETARKADAAVRGSVNGTTAGDPEDAPSKRGRTKSAGDPPLIDTAYERHTDRKQ